MYVFLNNVFIKGKLYCSHACLSTTAMTYEVMKVYLQTFLISALDQSE
jgi:hypothetical protein